MAKLWKEGSTGDIKVGVPYLWTEQWQQPYRSEKPAYMESFPLEESQHQLRNPISTNPASNMVIGLLLIAATGAIVVYMVQNGVIQMPNLGGDKDKKGTVLVGVPGTPSQPGASVIPTTVPGATTQSQVSTGFDPNNPFPSLNSQGVLAQDVVDAFTFVKQAAQQSNLWPWPGFRDGSGQIHGDAPTDNPDNTIISVQPWLGRVIPSTTFPPQQYVDEYWKAIIFIKSRVA